MIVPCAPALQIYRTIINLLENELAIKGITLKIRLHIIYMYCIQLLQLTLSDQSTKLQDKTARLCGTF